MKLKQLKAVQQLQHQLGRKVKRKHGADAVNSAETHQSEVLIDSQRAGITLEILPNEILQKVALYLDDPFEACLVLSSKTLLKIVGNESFKRMSTSSLRNPKNLNTFLFLLNRDLPNHGFCEGCRILHNHAGTPASQYPKFARRFKESKLVERAAVKLFRQVVRVVCPSTGFFWVKAAISDWKQYMDGFHGVATRYNGVYNEQHHAYLRKVNNTIFEREQNSLLLSWESSEGGMPTNLIPFPDHTSFHPPCVHLYNSTIAKRLLWQLECRYEHWNDNKQCPVCSGVFQCSICMAEYQIDGFGYGERGVVITMTIWSLFSSMCHKRLPVEGPNTGPLPASSKRIALNESIIRNQFEGHGNDFFAESCVTARSRDMLCRESKGVRRRQSRHMEFEE